MGSSPGWEDSSELVVGAESLIRLQLPNIRTHLVGLEMFAEARIFSKTYCV